MFSFGSKIWSVGLGAWMRTLVDVKSSSWSFYRCHVEFSADFLAVNRSMILASSRTYSKKFNGDGLEKFWKQLNKLRFFSENRQVITYYFFNSYRKLIKFWVGLQIFRRYYLKRMENVKWRRLSNFLEKFKNLVFFRKIT